MGPSCKACVCSPSWCGTHVCKHLLALYVFIDWSPKMQDPDIIRSRVIAVNPLLLRQFQN